MEKTENSINESVIGKNSYAQTDKFEKKENSRERRERMFGYKYNLYLDEKGKL